MNHQESEKLFEPNSRSIPNGVVSLCGRFSHEIAFVRGKGAYLWDVDGNPYIDYFAGDGSYLLGHGDDEVEEAVVKAIRDGATLSASGALPWEGEAAELLCQCIPTLDQVLFTNSASEATYCAIRLARAVTERQHVVVMQGGYNGGHDYVACNFMNPIGQVGPQQTHGEYPFVGMSAGMEETVSTYVHVAEFNSLESVRAIFSKYPVACLITEPILQNIGVVKPLPGYLQGLQDLCAEFGAVFVIDEVKTCFRHSLAGYHSLENLKPDLLVLGKTIANGYPISALGGKRDLMSHFVHPDAKKRVMPADTQSVHPVPLAASIATMRKLLREAETLYPKLERLSQKLASGLEEAFRGDGKPCVVARQASAMAPYFMDHAPVSWHDITAHHDMEADVRFRRECIDAGVYLLPVAVQQISVSAAHTDADIDRTLEVIRGAAKKVPVPTPRQFLMRRPDLEGLPPIQIPEGYELRPYQTGDAPSAAETLSLAFQEEWSIERVLGELAESTFVKTMFVIVHGGTVVATASAAYGDNRPDTGYVHYVATHPSHTGKRLGYWVTLATLHEFVRLGYHAAVLNTDDFRLPAIRTYLNLGFVPEHICPTHPARWAAVYEALGGHRAG